MAANNSIAPDKNKTNRVTEKLSATSVLVACSGALFLSLIVFIAQTPKFLYNNPNTNLLLKASLTGFFFSQAFSLTLGIIGFIKVKLDKKKSGLPEALLGILSSIIFAAVVLIYLFSKSAGNY